MKVTVQKKDILRALRRASAIAPSKAMPVLANVLLVANGKTLEVLATDASLLSFRGEVDATGTAGRGCVNAKALSERVAAMPEGPIDLALDGDCLRVVSGERMFALPTTDADDYPLVPPVAGGSWVEFNAHDFGVAVGKVKHAIMTEETGSILTYMQLTASNGRMVFVATDSRRCARAEAPFAGSDFAVLIHRRAVAELARYLEDEDADLSMALDGGRLHVRIGGSVLSVVTSDGAFPSVDRYFDAPPGSSSAKIAKAALIDAVKSAALASDEAGGVTLALGGGSCSVSSEAQQLGSARDRLAAETQGAGINVCLRWRYLLDALANVAVDDVSLDTSSAGPVEPFFVRDGVGDRAYSEVIMPMGVK